MTTHGPSSVLTERNNIHPTHCQHLPATHRATTTPLQILTPRQQDWLLGRIHHFLASTLPLRHHLCSFRAAPLLLLPRDEVTLPGESFRVRNKKFGPKLKNRFSWLNKTVPRGAAVQCSTSCSPPRRARLRINVRKRLPKVDPPTCSRRCIVAL